MSTNADRTNESWESRLERTLPVFGHRNWIVIADSAYPDQSRPGIETLFTGVDHGQVLDRVFAAVDAAAHVRANVYVDAELDLVNETDAPGINALRSLIGRHTGGRKTQTLPHEAIIARLDEAGKVFRILILKSNLAIPYTSVFLELDCGYWSAEAEKRLRELQQTRGSGNPDAG